MQKPEEKLPEGKLRADENNKSEQTLKLNEGGDNERNAQTGYSPQEAIIQLRSYADDQKFNNKALQFLQRKETPVGGKDY